MLNIVNHKKPKRKWRIPALGRMILGAAEPEDDELIKPLDAGDEQALVLEPVQDGEALVRYWSGVEDELLNDVDDIDFALD